jgi:predicted enzyme related to lactoylglutathione lyase
MSARLNHDSRRKKITTHLQPKPAGAPTWTDLTSPDTEAARTFYHAVFGWEYDIGVEFGGYATARLGNRSTVGANAKQALTFYTALLHATAEPMPGGMECYTLKHGDDPICGIMQIDPAWGNMAAQWVNYFAVVNADETVATVVKHGGKNMAPVDDSPFGAIFKIVQPPPSLISLNRQGEAS